MDGDEIDEETLRRIVAAEEAWHASVEAAMRLLYGRLPKWVPLPNIERARRVVVALINDGISAENILARVTEEVEGRPILVPGIIRDAGAYFRNVNELAHLRYAVTLGKADGLLILAGKSAAHGQKFADGKKQGSFGPIRKAIRRLLKASPSMKNSQLWEAIANAPPAGWEAFNNREGKYLESFSRDSRREVKFKTFQNLCAEERKQQQKGKKIPE